jgi:hypothetical protein
MQHGTWTKLGAEIIFPFNSKPDLNTDLENTSNSQEYFELCITPETAKLISRETNRYAQ